ncbi:MAG: hypothetical protein D5R99_05990 [Methanocalculus sp. MSAO_Arc1]|nr:MAG: hypothetical protein D5R99_05990 [Methanocalculus sp. MSAO_Arc1]
MASNISMKQLALLFSLLCLFVFLCGCAEAPPPGDQVVPEQPVTEDWVPDGTVGEGEYHYSQQLSDSMTIHWRTTETTLQMALVGRAEGWVGIGFGTGRMASGIDYIVGYVDGDAVVRDMYSESPRCPIVADTDLGGRDDIIRSGGSQRDGITTIEFERPLDTGDPYDHVLEAGEAIPIIWALSDTHDIGVRHRERGTATITLREV